jgi:hypothetical protein
MRHREMVGPIEAADLVAIEHGTGADPKPRIVFKLATHFSLPTHRFMQLSGSVESHDQAFHDGHEVRSQV